MSETASLWDLLVGVNQAYSDTLPQAELSQLQARFRVSAPKAELHIRITPKKDIHVLNQIPRS